MPTSASRVRFINALPCEIRVRSEMYNDPILNSQVRIRVEHNLNQHIASKCL